ncbi:hypothetical protein [Corallococcus macrosporus]|uniref:Uncharacterized protein n=1 Tax=Corallococcus macrosporus DSM 14697 TaxID=1189310 RepID=A0A250JR97_9BACT|nr:hypothetical protein [Corallococcus macrosporus]ATB46355.1 hypothetical protein MYMAC_001947 [Corallococcus macrosporus DSM 14697]
MHSTQPPAADEAKALAQREAEAARLRREDAVDVLAEALWELWVRQHLARTPQPKVERAEKHTHG